MRILVINPNSSPVVSAGIASALTPLGEMFEVIGCADGPDTIRSDLDVANAAAAVAGLCAGRPDAASFIIACFSDPGVDLARRQVPQPVIGVQEAALLEACRIAERYGIIALSKRAIPRHLERIAALGCLHRLVDELPLNDVSAAESGRDPQVHAHILDLASELRDRGAGAIVLGCAGMGHLAARLEREIGIPVVDPVAAAGRLALERFRNALPGVLGDMSGNAFPTARPAL